MTLRTELAERRLLPDAVIRLGVRRLLRERLRTEWARAPRTVITYLRGTKRQLGLLINFNVEHLRDGIKRIVLT